MLDAITVLAIAQKYTDDSIAGASKGKNCEIQSIVPITGGHRVTFIWYDENNTPETSTMDVMDGEDGQSGANGVGISSIAFKEKDANGNNVYTIILTNGDTYDFTSPKGDKGDVGALDYTTQTKEVGTWIDGKTIYQQVLSGSIPGTGTNGTEASTDISLNDTVDKYVSLSLVMRRNVGHQSYDISQAFAMENGILLRAWMKGVDGSSPTTGTRNRVFIYNNWTELNAVPFHAIVQYTRKTS